MSMPTRDVCATSTRHCFHVHHRTSNGATLMLASSLRREQQAHTARATSPTTSLPLPVSIAVLRRSDITTAPDSNAPCQATAATSNDGAVAADTLVPTHIESCTRLHARLYSTPYPAIAGRAHTDTPASRPATSFRLLCFVLSPLTRLVLPYSHSTLLLARSSPSRHTGTSNLAPHSLPPSCHDSAVARLRAAGRHASNGIIAAFITAFRFRQALFSAAQPHMPNARLASSSSSSSNTTSLPSPFSSSSAASSFTSGKKQTSCTRSSTIDCSSER